MTTSVVGRSEELPAMKTVIVYYSRFGHTRRLAEAMAEQLAPAGSARALAIDQVAAADLQGADLVMMGAPTHRMRLPEEVRPFFETLPRKCLRGAAVAAFDTSYRMSRFLARFSAAKTLDAKLRKLGGKRVAPPETFFMAGREGPLEDGEIERARAWAGALAAAVRR
jgi:flavodoxin